MEKKPETKETKSDGAETRPKKEARTPKTIMVEKVNSAGSIILKQIRKLESAQQNAIKCGEIDQFNKAVTHLAEQFGGLIIPENATADTTPETVDFDMSKVGE